MRPGKPTTEPKHLQGVSKTCPRINCPNPTLAIKWRGSHKQLQYHCFGCWRKFNYGGKNQPWAKQVAPPASWLRQQTPYVTKAPALLRLPRPSVAGSSALQDDDTTEGPSQKRGQRRRRGGRSVASSSTMTQDDTTHGPHAVTHFNIAPDIAGPNPERSRRADVIKEEDTRADTVPGDDHGVLTASISALNEIDFVTNGCGEDEGHDHGTRTPPTPSSQSMNNLMEDFYLGDGAETPMWQCFTSPIAHGLWEEVTGTGILSTPAIPSIDLNPIVDGSDDLQVVSCLVGTESAHASTHEYLARPRRRSMTITFNRYSVPSKTCYYELEG